MSLNKKKETSLIYIMDDFNVSSLHESRNEWGARLLTILTPLIIEGIKSIFKEAYDLCEKNKEKSKYLMTFQNFLGRIKDWNSNIIESERKRIIDKSGCNYLEDLITCIHIIQLKLLTAMRVGQKQKKIDINIPKLDTFIHKVYLNVARKIYLCMDLFAITKDHLITQKNNRELETIVKECILTTVRDSIPIENILKAYMDETVEEDVVEEIKEQTIEPPSKTESATILEGKLGGKLEEKSDGNVSLKFNDVDSAISNNGKEELINAPKTIDRLEEISALRNMQRKMEEEEDDEILKISNESVPIDMLGIDELTNEPDLILEDIEILS